MIKKEELVKFVGKEVEIVTAFYKYMPANGVCVKIDAVDLKNNKVTISQESGSLGAPISDTIDLREDIFFETIEAFKEYSDEMEKKMLEEEKVDSLQDIVIQKEFIVYIVDAA